ncbi:MAG: PadR family transcriptional regulator [Gaiellaceae bacterium]|jgi:DNA-binding PadR family transcriptional regulator
MSRASLTPVSYLVLGWIAHNPATPYELKQRVANSVGYFWHFPHSQLYAEPARLVTLGLLEEEQEQHGRRRRIYSITDRGRAALEEWLRQPTSEQPQIRDIGLLKLFFSSTLESDTIVTLARAQEQSHRKRLAVYEELEREIPEHAGFAHASLRMGFAVERAFIEFWSGIATDPPSDSSLPPAPLRQDNAERSS